MEKIENFITECQRTKNAFFWTPTSHASGRRNFEKKNSFGLNFTAKIKRYKLNHIFVYGVKIIANLRLECSCRNVYRYCDISINDIQANLTVLKHLNDIIDDKKLLNSRFIRKYHLKCIFH